MDSKPQNSKSNAKKKSKEKSPEQCLAEECKSREIKQLVLAWADYTTIHGIRFLVSPEDRHGINCNSPRRFSWLLIVLISTAFVMRQISERILHFNSLPISVNVEIFNNHSLIFPTITFCNQNSFKLTRAYESGFYETIADFYLKRKSIYNTTDYQHLKLNITLDQLYNLTSFRLEDMLLECRWLGEPCHPDNFTQIMTDQGLCYSFNSKPPYLQVNDSGTGKGLVLLLNIQQYDYIPQAFGSAGIRFLSHPPEEVPMITENGDAAQTGTHTFIGLTTSSTFNRAMKTKKCAENNGTDYRFDKCHLNCRTEFYIEKCKCRDIYMPDITGNSTYCTLSNIACLNKAEENYAIEKHDRHDLTCPIDCEEIHIESSLSSLSMTSQDMDNINDIQNIVNKMEKSYTRSRDIARLAIKDYYHKDMKILGRTMSSIKKTFGYFSEALSQGRYMEDTFDFERRNILNELNYKIDFLMEQETIVRKLFYNGYISAKSRTLDQVSHRMFEFAMLITRAMENLSKREMDGSVRQMILYDASLQIAEKKAAAKAAYNKLSELHDCYKNGKPYWTSVKEVKLSPIQIGAILPRRLLKTVPDILETVFNMKWSVSSLKNLSIIYEHLNATLFSTYDTFNHSSEELKSEISHYLKNSKEWDYFRGSALDLVFPKPVNFLENRIAHAKSLRESLANSELMGIPKFDNISSSLEELENNDFLKTLSQLIHKCITARQRPSVYYESPLLFKSWLTDHFSNYSIQIESILSKVENSVNKLSIYRSRWPLRWQQLDDILKKIWVLILSDKDAYFQYQLRNKQAWLQMDIEQVKQNFSRFSSSLASQISCIDNAANCKNPLNDFLKALVDDLTEYGTMNSINAELIRRNVLRLEFFFRQLRWEKVMKEWSYDFAALISDIGGAIGLFVGGSILSVIEVVDLLILILSAAKKQVHQHATAYIEEKRIEKEEQEAYYRPLPFLVKKDILLQSLNAPVVDDIGDGQAISS